jgi:hypothetical protein
MWRRKRLLNWNTIRFGQTLGSAHQESRSLSWMNFAFKMFSKSMQTGNVLSTIESQGTENEWLRSQVIWNWYYPSGKSSGAWMTLLPGTASRRGKGKPEGSAVTGKTRKLWVAEKSLVLYEAAGQNNSSLTSWATSVVNGEWELIKRWVPIIVFIILPLYPDRVSFFNL